MKLCLHLSKSVNQNSDGGFLIVAETESYGHGQKDIWLIKTNDFGIMQWNNTFGNDKSDLAGITQQTLDDGYIIIGTTFIHPFGNDFWLIKTDNFGRIEIPIGNLISKNLLKEKNVYSLNFFNYTTLIPNDTIIFIQFSF